MRPRPLANLSELVSHEQQFLACLGEHVAEQQSQVSKPLPFVPRHFANQGAFAMDNFIVRQREYEIFRETVQHTEGELVVMVFAMNGIVGEIL